jgi:hypothetical protein
MDTNVTARLVGRDDSLSTVVPVGLQQSVDGETYSLGTACARHSTVVPVGLRQSVDGETYPLAQLVPVASADDLADEETYGRSPSTVADEETDGRSPSLCQRTKRLMVALEGPLQRQSLWHSLCPSHQRMI